MRNYINFILYKNHLLSCVFKTIYSTRTEVNKTEGRK